MTERQVSIVHRISCEKRPESGKLIIVRPRLGRGEALDIVILIQIASPQYTPSSLISSVGSGRDPIDRTVLASREVIAHAIQNLLAQVPRPTQPSESRRACGRKIRYLGQGGAIIAAGGVELIYVGLSRVLAAYYRQHAVLTSVVHRGTTDSREPFTRPAGFLCKQ
jgi:hypothetical protein